MNLQAAWLGATGIEMDSPPTLEALLKRYRQWHDSWRSDPHPLKIVLRRWIDAHDVQLIVNTLDRQTRRVFSDHRVHPFIETMLRRELEDLKELQESLSQAMTWPELKSNKTAEFELMMLQVDVHRHMIKVGHLDQITMLRRQVELMSGDQSWFTSYKVRLAYERIKTAIGRQDQIPTQLPTPLPTADPTVSPTFSPTTEPLSQPTPQPTAAPTPAPTVAPTVVPTTTSTQALYPLGVPVLIQSHRNQNLQDNNGQVSLSGNALAWEQWKIIDAGDGKVTIKSHRNQNLQDNNGEVKLSGSALAWEQWTISDAGDGKFTISSHRNQNLQDNNGQIMLSGNADAWEQWSITAVQA